MELQGYAVEIATDGASGLARIAQGGIDVVALDHYMPNQDGLETLASIRKLAEPPPVIYVTAAQEVSVAVAALKAGAVDYVAKDTQGEFLPLLRRAIDAAFFLNGKLQSEITARMLAEEALAKAAAELAAIQTAVSEVAIIAVTDVTGKIEQVNDNFVRISKYSREELIGQDHRLVNSGVDMTTLTRILLIDDDKVDRTMVRRALEKSGLEYDLVEAPDGASGLRCAKARAFDCVLLDYRHPDVDAFELLTVLLSPEGGGQAVLMLTGETDQEIANRLMRAGALDYLTKDEVTPSRLARAIRYAQARWECLAELKTARREAEERALVLDTLNREKAFLNSIIAHDLRNSFQGLLGL